ncbi:MAG: nucleotide exchange factor GrpE [Chloroflexi bacterium]|nr:MAG: nucleotide exchange factor GrpE [Chloroflexota bacterium]
MSADTQNTESGMSSGTRAEVRELERQLDEARAQVKVAEERAQENLDRWQRAQADLVNYRRRTQFDREQELKFAGLPLITEMLRIFDGFDRAWKSLPVALRNLSWIEGIWMLDQQFQEIVRRTGLTRIDQVDQPFDPRLHDAIATEPGEGDPYVLEVFQAGYELHDRVVRPALVKAGPRQASGPSIEEEPETGHQHDHTHDQAGR